MLAVQRRPMEDASAIAGPSRLPTQPTKIKTPTPRRVKAKARSPSYSPSDSDSEIAKVPTTPRPRATTTPSRPPSRTERRYQCKFAGCDKAYFKPSRLKEHELTHTGERPHPCPHCDQTYLRASHLTAHMRTHLPSSARTFECNHEGCDKAFWTATHLKRHQVMHEKTEVYNCKHCSQTFHKANQLRDHHAMAHMPAGTKSFICTHEGCSSSFAMRQQLKAHEKTHDVTRYTCSHPSHDSHPTFPTWSALQIHLHTVHPPECPHPECGGRTFKSAHKLKDHLKVHALRAEEGRTASDGDDGEGNVGIKPKKRRRSSVADDGETSRRKKSKIVNGVKEVPDTSFTGDSRRYGCPIQHLPEDALNDTEEKGARCYARFWRVYDIRRHLKAGHGVDLEDEEVRELLALAKEAE